jgi:hypothetical protein
LGVMASMQAAGVPRTGVERRTKLLAEGCLRQLENEQSLFL